MISQLTTILRHFLADEARHLSNDSGLSLKIASETWNAILKRLFLAASAFPDSSSKSAPPISARYTKLNNDGSETNCIVTGNETQEERQNMQEIGCTLETLRKESDIEVEVTLQTNTGFRSILLTSKYYLMWINSGLHAVNIIRNLPCAVTSLVDLHPIDSLGYLAYSVLYNVGLSRNANQTLYPFLGEHFSSYFYPDGKDKNSEAETDNSDEEVEKVGIGGHILIIGADLIMWWLDVPIAGFNINRLMLGLDLLHFALDMAI
ncbi:hypothetical protein CAPTEDRAFT_214354 [Capitella teleta]|uniref:Uncharacterized protein n=1 Tax=Capitella teleta TaxID=283909 RepID=R7UKM5_CAPTE|nr:hypothetical protein CAPTEDRAFT_214354 [Capitella teleta]|eukprot:ELU06785.1 hypothetical protein CAPTEDRAFT_214354 [Capitella teleta]